MDYLNLCRYRRSAAVACNQDLRNADKMGIQAAVERRFGLYHAVYV